MGNTIPIILNAKAGATHASLGPDQLRRMARDVGFEADVLQTHTAEEMRKSVRRLVAQGVPRLGVAGGDGTVRAAVQELAHTKTALGIIAQGTFNNFATALRLPQTLPGALKTLASGHVRPVDLGKVGDHYFTESAGVGLFADGLARLGEENQKNVVLAFYTALRLWYGLRVHRMTITVDGVPHVMPIALCEVANTYRIGTGIPIAPEAEVSDGLFDVVTIGAIQRRELPDYLTAVRSQLHLDLPEVRVLRAKREVRIEPHRPRNVHCDDSIIGSTPVTITMEQGALNVLIDESR